MQRGAVLPLILVIILLVLLGGAGVYYYQAKLSNLKGNDVPPGVIYQKPSPTSEMVSIESLGLKFGLPAGYKVVKETEKEYFMRANGQIRKNFNYYVLYNPAEFAEAFYVTADSEKNLDKAILTVWVFQNPEDLDPEKFYEKYWYYPFVWGDFTARKNEITPKDIELIGGKEGKFGVVGYRDEKPKFIYLPLRGKNLMIQIQLPDGNLTAKEILQSFKFE